MVEAGAEAAASEEDLPALESPLEAPASDLPPPPRAVVRCFCLWFVCGLFCFLNCSALPSTAPAPTPASRDVVEPFDPSGWTSFCFLSGILILTCFFVVLNPGRKVTVSTSPSGEVTLVVNRSFQEEPKKSALFAHLS